MFSVRQVWRCAGSFAKRTSASNLHVTPPLRIASPLQSAGQLRKSSAPTVLLRNVRPVVTTVHVKPGQNKTYLDEKNRLLKVYWAGGKELIFPYVWLRDSCRCPKCFHPVTLSRLQLMRNFDVDCYPKELMLDDEKEKLKVIWNDDHVSVFDYDFLEKRSFTPEEQKARLDDCELGKRVLWGKKDLTDISRHEYSSVVTSDTGFYNMLLDLHMYGITIIWNAPKSVETIRELTAKVAYPMETNYGRWFQVKSMPNPSNLAYTADCLGLHVDLPFYERCPGVQLLHCLSQDEGIIGGENQFTDAVYVAYRLKEVDPEAYRLLSTLKIDFYDYGTDHIQDFHLAYRQNIIHTDKEGNIERVFYNSSVRDYQLNISWEDVQPFFNAHRKFEDMLNADSIEHRLKEGEIVVFNNQRVLHGRSAYRMSASSERFLSGCYWRWDEVNSRIRRLKEKIQENK